MRDWLFERLSRFADREALVCDGRLVRYQDLRADIEDWLQVLDDHALPAHAVVALRGRYSPATVSLFLALACNDNIVTPLPTAGPDPEDLLALSHAEMFFDFGDGDRSTASRRCRTSGPRCPPTGIPSTISPGAARRSRSTTTTVSTR